MDNRDDISDDYAPLPPNASDEGHKPDGEANDPDECREGRTYFLELDQWEECKVRPRGP